MLKGMVNQHYRVRDATNDGHVLLEEAIDSRALMTSTAIRVKTQGNNTPREGILEEVEREPEGVEVGRTIDNLKGICPIHLLEHPLMAEVRKYQLGEKEEFGIL